MNRRTFITGAGMVVLGAPISTKAARAVAQRSLWQVEVFTFELPGICAAERVLINDQPFDVIETSHHETFTRFNCVRARV